MHKALVPEIVVLLSLNLRRSLWRTRGSSRKAGWLGRPNHLIHPFPPRQSRVETWEKQRLVPAGMSAGNWSNDASRATEKPTTFTDVRIVATTPISIMLVVDS